MDQEERSRLRKMYEEEVSDEDLAEMALTNPKEYEQGVYDLVMVAVKERGLLEVIDDIKRGDREDVRSEKWIEIHRFYDESEKVVLAALFKDKNIPVNIISRECSAYDGMFKSSAGLGIIRVKESSAEPARKIIEDFRNEAQSDGAVLEDNVIIQAAIKVLGRRGIADKEIIAEEIIREIENNPQ